MSIYFCSFLKHSSPRNVVQCPVDSLQVQNIIFYVFFYWTWDQSVHTFKLKTLLKIWLFKRVKKFCKVSEHKCLVPLQVVLSSSACQKYWKQTLFCCFSVFCSFRRHMKCNLVKLAFTVYWQFTILNHNMAIRALLVSPLGWH